MAEQNVLESDTMSTPQENVAANVARFRERHGWTQQQLADLLSSYGLHWNRSAIAKIETGPQGRQVTVDELCALAFALGVPVVRLLLPLDDEDSLRITPNTTMPESEAWMIGLLPAGGQDPNEHKSLDADRFYFEACSDNEARAERYLPGVRDLVRSARRVVGIAGLAHRTYVPGFGPGQTPPKRRRVSSDAEVRHLAIAALQRLHRETELLASRLTSDDTDDQPLLPRPRYDRATRSDGG